MQAIFCLHDLRMAQGTQCLDAISNYMRKVELKYQHVIGHNYATIQQFKESRDKKNYLHDVISGIPGINMLPRVSCSDSL